MKLLFDTFFVTYGFISIALTIVFSVQAFEYLPYVFIAIIAQGIVILVPYTLVWLYFRERIR